MTEQSEEVYMLEELIYAETDTKKVKFLRQLKRYVEELEEKLWGYEND